MAAAGAVYTAPSGLHCGGTRRAILGRVVPNGRRGDRRRPGPSSEFTETENHVVSGRYRFSQRGEKQTTRRSRWSSRVYPMRSASFIRAESVLVPSAAPWPNRITRSAASRAGGSAVGVRASERPTSGAGSGPTGVCACRRRRGTESRGVQRESPRRMRRDSRNVLTCNKSALPRRVHVPCIISTTTALLVCTRTQ
ncbi:hypothetical protein EYF80_005012 [Liparis tanakae]|uniref:Uncharacterized protein n=1 Tax=Liparis tanakae TaxID=230148 RepID=A0A4Z2J4M2_9TELE|nr:hypothetical protein EYF80_005012 [Liparis tanakae]